MDTCLSPSKYPSRRSSLYRYEEIVDDFAAFLEFSERPLPRTIWLNPLKCDKSILETWLDTDLKPIAWNPDAFRSPDGDRKRYYAAYLAGLFHIQEEASMLPAELLRIATGSSILDLCAAPGNKTAQAACKTGYSGTVVANDVSRTRVGVIQTIMNRLSLTNVCVTVTDAGIWPLEGPVYDYVIADVPCSCEGTSRKNRRVLLKNDPAYRLALIRRQERILTRALELCAPGGYVAYSTCTYAPEENEGVVSAVLKNSRFGEDAKIIPIDCAGLRYSAGISSWNGVDFHSDISHSIRIWPHQQDTGGFFVAILQKAGTRRKAISQRSEEQPSSITSETMTDLSYYGLTTTFEKQFISMQLSPKYRSILENTIVLPTEPVVQAAGVRGISTRGEAPHLSTAGAMRLGGVAERQVLSIPLNQIEQFYCGHTFGVFLATEPSNRPEPGKVIVKSGNIPVGLGVLRQQGESYQLESQFPKKFGGIRIKDVLGY